MAFVAVSGGITNLGTDAAVQYGVFDDTILILSGNNTIHTWEGNDTVYANRSSSVSLQIAFLGLGNDRYFGGAGSDNVADGAGNDFCDLGAGIDRVRVGMGNDVYYGGAGVDEVDFQRVYNDDGTSTPNTTGVTFDLAKTGLQNLGIFGVDRFIGFENVFGSEVADKLFGSEGANQIEGLGGNDIINGRAGNDTVEGGDGSDFLVGGLGQDRYVNAESVAARDRFAFLSIADSAASTLTCDSISDFDAGGGATDDKIDLSFIDADMFAAGNQAFLFRGSGAFTSLRGEVRFVVAGGNTFVQVDTDADPAAEMIIRVDGVTGLTAADFML